MQNNVGLKELAFCAALCVATPAQSADIVTLETRDGTVQLSGELLGYDGEFYQLKSKYGELTLKAVGIICRGLACPDPGQFAADVSIAGAEEIGSTLFPGLIEDFSFSTGYESLRSDQRSGGWTYFISDGSNTPVARLQARLGESGDGFIRMTEHHADFALSTRLPKDDETTSVSEAKAGDLDNPYSTHVVGLDALVFVVSRENPIQAISAATVTRILTGEIKNWSKIGGLDAPISVYHREANADISVELALALSWPTDEPPLVVGTVLESNAEVSDSVARDPFGFGVTGFSAIRNSRALALKGTCGIRTSPTRFTLQAEDYPLTRRLFLFTPQRRLPLFARDFLAWLDTTPAQLAVEEHGFVGQEVRAKPFSDQQDRIANAVRAAGADIRLSQLQSFVRTFSGASRLSSTFRFDDNSTNLDIRSRRNVALLGQMIEVGDFNGRELIFAGFSDSQGGPEGNRRISRQRAEQVASAVRAAASRADLTKLRMRVIGLGEVSPLACDDTESGRRINRRVEVWLK
jgi:phosphate transport system substrate-binding protein